MGLRSILVGAFWICPLAWGQGTQVCLSDHVKLGSRVLAAFQAQLAELAPGLAVETGNCQARLRVSILWDAPQRHPSALGQTYVASNRVLPQIEIYLNPVLRLLNNARTPALVGRALARVAAHELIHYRSQRTDHDHAGVFRASFTPAYLKP